VRQQRSVAFAVAAHPDDIEFMMAGTLLLLGEAGYELHYLNIANGSCGTAVHSKEDIIRIRTAEARAAARLLGAMYHPPFVDDIDIFYENDLLAKVAAVVREVQPTIMLVPSPQDYMEDHVNAGRLAITAAFCREMRNFPTDPPIAPVGGGCDSLPRLAPWLAGRVASSRCAGMLCGHLPRACRQAGGAGAAPEPEGMAG